MDQRELTDLLSDFITPEMRAEAEHAMHRDMSTQNKNIRVVPPDPTMESPKVNIDGIDLSDKDRFRDAILKSLAENAKPRFPPLESLPCANVEIEKHKACEKPGVKACSACKLVSYCSKECQKVHWRVHKRDCNDHIGSDDWKPAWMLEGRRPSFINNETQAEEFERRKTNEFSTGLSLWGNMPAMDVINLANNEKDATKDFSLAFVASGDLRHVVHTINALPADYSGDLKILVNDITLPIVCRNIILLLILGTIADEVIAADIALHFWYSTFLPMEYRLRLSGVLNSLLQHIESGRASFIPLGPHSTLSFFLPKESVKYFLHYISSLAVGEIQDEYDRVRSAPSRRDFRDRKYVRLKPSHRIAFEEYGRFGIVLPFGAANAHFNTPNLSLFSPEGKWLQTDYADPLAGWNTDDVIKAGKAHGAQPEDIYGCLYFFLSEELRSFARRLRRFRVSFNVYCTDASLLSRGIRENVFSVQGIPASFRFDRIEVANILDANYVGLRGVLENWAPMLREGRDAAIVGYFMNWIAVQEDGAVRGAGERAMMALLPSLVKKTKSQSLKLDISPWTMMPGDLDALYENWGPFSKYLKKQGLDDILRKAKVTLRKRHTIVPHRIGAPLFGLPNALPEFPDEDSWYYYTRVASFAGSERFVEFART